MTLSFETRGGLHVARSSETVAAGPAYEGLLQALDGERGMLLQCSVTYPGRYRPQWRGFVAPALQVVCRQGRFAAEALGAGGRAPLALVAASLGGCEGALAALGGAFGLLRRLTSLFGATADPEFALYAALGYDLALDHYGIARRQARDPAQPDAIFYLPAELLVCRDPASGQAERLTWRFEGATGAAVEPATIPARAPLPAGDPPAGQYRAVVERARQACRAGTLYEVVAGQSFRRPFAGRASALYRRLEAINPSPYGFLANLGGEHLVGASPEMFVRVTGDRVESCPISGTVRRGRDACEDAERALGLLNSAKAEAELTMCTDIDRNDKAAVCVPGSIRVIGRRQLETYSHLIHTVDHVSGRLRSDCDAIDALRAHLWSVTLTGAPRPAALAFIEANENAPRRWYGGAIGRIGMDGDLDSGIVLRAIQLCGGVAEVRVGASLLHSSDPEDEERETLTKAAAMFGALAGEAPKPPPAPQPGGALAEVLLADRGGPFTALLASQLASHGVRTRPLTDGASCDGGTVLLLSGADPAAQGAARDLAGALLGRGCRLLGIGHGMLALAEALGARSQPAPEPRHGARLRVGWCDPATAIGGLLPPGSAVGCYHRALLDPASLPAAVTVALRAEAGEILAFEAPERRCAGLLFHPESLLTEQGTALLVGLL
jgi:anthranilate synthase